MGFDAIASSPLSSFAKNSTKNKKGSKMGKLRKNKLDVPREKWFSNQVNGNVYKAGTNNSARSVQSSVSKSIDGHKTQRNLPIIARGDERHEILTTFDNETASWISSNLGHNSLGKTFPGSFSKKSDSSKNGSSFSGSSCSSSCSEEEREDHCLDDWEAVADALTEDISNHKQRSFEPQQLVNNTRKEGSRRAWTPDDAFRPRSLPSLSKGYVSRGPMEMKWQRRVITQQPSSCPICCEELDVTDAKFLPCPCGFQLCLFCHNRILEVDGRCPGCRKQYDTVNSEFADDSLGCQMVIGDSFLKHE